MKTLFMRSATLSKNACQVAHSKLITNSNTLSLALGTVLIVGGLTDIAMAQSAEIVGDYKYDQTRIASAVEFLLRMIEGSLGALIMVVAGIGAIFAAAMGAYRAAVGMIVVAVGAFILRSLVSLFFGEDFQGVEKHR